ncbi:sialate O-acetylesterase [Membranihabitans marinus]|uniref:sialate O-acetylesterase n=1 Tax=Membranihabitans marinus TaxID=1227546 RepID=UPI001F29F2B9|nr:sialate O-acetylesterase [Membranihabitans marinus]
MNKMIFRMLGLVMGLIPFLLSAQTKLPTFFGDHMVLQQKESVDIWGWDKPGQTVKIKSSWGQESKAKTDDDGRWTASINTPAAGGPYQVSISGSENVQLRDVMIGEVWICSGQSNMSMALKGYDNQPIFEAGETILKANQSNIRMYTAGRKASVEALDDLEGDWKVSSTETASDFSAAAYHFGLYLEEMLDVPVGLIVTAWGGSRVEAWMNEAGLKDAGVNNIPTEIPSKSPHHAPTLLYNAMISPLVPYKAKGFLWYQGESNVGNAHEYTKLFSNMIEGWRKDWNNSEMPFYFVEIAPYNYGSRNSAYLREAQLNTQKNLANTGMAGTMDLGNCSNIHPGDKKNVGRRLALWALSQTYGMKGIEYSGPIYKSMEINDASIELSFDHADRGFSTYGEPIQGFEIAGEDGDFVEADVSFNRSKKTIVVSSKSIAEPKVVRYGFGNCPEANLFNTYQLPAPSFRTDQ